MATKDFLDVELKVYLKEQMYNEVPVSCEEVFGFRSCVFLPDT